MEALINLDWADFPFNKKGRGPSHKGIVELSAHLTVDEAFAALIKHDILSAPVYDDTETNKFKGKKREYLGFFDTFDVIRLLVKIEDTVRELPDKEFSMQRTKEIAERGAINDNGKLLGAKLTLKEHFNAQGGPLYPWCPVSVEDTVPKALNLLKKTRRVPIMNMSTNRVLIVISRKLVVNTLALKLTARDDAFLATPVSKKLGIKTVRVVKESQTVGMAYRKMAKFNVNAIGIVTDKNVLKYCVTSRDFHHFFSVSKAATQIYQFEQKKRLILGDKLKYDKFGEIVQDEDYKAGNVYIDDASDQLWGKPAIEMVKIARTNGRSYGFAPIVTVKPDADMKALIRKIDGINIHRVFITNEKGVPVGVASGKDIINVLVPPAGKPKSKPKSQ